MRHHSGRPSTSCGVLRVPWVDSCYFDGRGPVVRGASDRMVMIDDRSCVKDARLQPFFPFCPHVHPRKLHQVPVGFSCLGRDIRLTRLGGRSNGGWPVESGGIIGLWLMVHFGAGVGQSERCNLYGRHGLARIVSVYVWTKNRTCRPVAQRHRLLWGSPPRFFGGCFVCIISSSSVVGGSSGLWWRWWWTSSRRPR